MKSTTVLLALLPTIYAQAPQVIGAGIDPECDNALHVVYEYPAFFSTVYESAGTIFNFMGGTNSLVINNPPQTVVTSTMLTTTVTTTATTTATVTAGGNNVVSATIGAGIPSGTVTSIPSSSPFAIAYLSNSLASRDTTSDVKLGFSTANGTSDDPADASFWYIEDGQLRSVDGGIVGRNASDSYATIVASTNQNDVTTKFTLVDGILHWDSPDRGEATLYSCDGQLYAGFPDSPSSSCGQVLVGAVSKTVVDAVVASDASLSTTSGSTSGSTSTTSGDPSDNASVTSTTSTSSDASPTTSDPAATATGPATCPDDDGQVVDGYTITCGEGFTADSDGDVMITDTLQACLDLCSNTYLCVGVSFDNTGDDYCYLHSSYKTDIGDTSGNYDSAELADGSDGSTNGSGDGSGDGSDDGSDGSDDGDDGDDSGDGSGDGSDDGSDTTTTATTTTMTTTITTTSSSAGVVDDATTTTLSASTSTTASTTSITSTSTSSSTSSTSTSTSSTSTSTTTSSASTTSSTITTTITTTTAAPPYMNTTTTTSTTTTTVGAPNSSNAPECSDNMIEGFKIFCNRAITVPAQNIQPDGQTNSLTACIDACRKYDGSLTVGGVKCLSLSWFFNPTAAPGTNSACYMHGSDAGGIFTNTTGYHSAVLDDGSNDTDPLLLQ